MNVKNQMPYVVNPYTGKYIVDKGAAYYTLAEKIGFKKVRELARYANKPGGRKPKKVAPKRDQPTGTRTRYKPIGKPRKRTKDGRFMSAGGRARPREIRKKQTRTPRPVKRQVRVREPIIRERIIERPVVQYQPSRYSYDDEVPSSLSQYTDNRSFDEVWDI